MKKRVCIITAGHLASCPRMLKAADALARAGYIVRVVSTRYIPWATAGDDAVRRERKGLWDWTVVDWGRRDALFLNRWSGARQHAANKLAKILGPTRSPLQLTAAARGRVHNELVRAALSEPVDFFYGGGGALAATATAARRAGVPYAIDLEDFHSAEQDDTPQSRLAHALTERIENAVLPGAAFLTAGSEAIAEAYVSKYGVHPVPINNTFPLPSTIPDTTLNRDKAGLKLYWFSQTIGPRRGLEDAVRAMGLARISGELHLRGQAVTEYLLKLKQLAKTVAPQLEIVHHLPASPDEMVRLCDGYDVGLAIEPGFSSNNLLALSNKALTYILGGLAVVFTDTLGQRPLALDISDGAFLYSPGDVETLSRGLKRWADDKAALTKAKRKAWEAAARRWHWEHPRERGALLKAVGLVI